MSAPVLEGRLNSAPGFGDLLRRARQGLPDQRGMGWGHARYRSRHGNRAGNLALGAIEGHGRAVHVLLVTADRLRQPARPDLGKAVGQADGIAFGRVRVGLQPRGQESATAGHRQRCQHGQPRGGGVKRQHLARFQHHPVGMGRPLRHQRRDQPFPVEERQVRRLAGSLGQRLDHRPRKPLARLGQLAQRGQPGNRRPQAVDPGLGILLHQPVAGQFRQKTVSRRLVVARLARKVGQSKLAPKRRKAVEKSQRLANRGHSLCSLLQDMPGKVRPAQFSIDRGKTRGSI